MAEDPRSTTPPTPPPGQLYLGAELDPASGERTDRLVTLDPDDLVTHGVIVGMTGSGKTGLGVVLLEEALLQGVPCLIIDPKGDLSNLALTFPELQPEQFLPWVDVQQAAREGQTPDQAAAAAAQQWRDGLASWGLDGARIAALRAAATVTVYTPGSRAGVGLDLIGSLTANDPEADEESRNDEIEGLVSGLLGLAGIDGDPLTSPEHILLSNLVAEAWRRGTKLDLAGLVGMVQDPPMRKLGVLDLDTFFPPDQRRALALRLNGLLASPSFAAWSQGEPLHIDRLLAEASGKPRAAVISLAHLSDSERQFVVAVLLTKLVTWMRRQSGTTGLRALVYMDEVFGFVPPNAMPPAKLPILTILKQARAFGVGMVLASQNPVDLDYRALSNAGTWMIGRLQTERDVLRLMEGLTAASGATDAAAVERTISSLAKRQFVLQRAGSGGLRRFTTRWAMSYLRGPLDRAQLGTLRGTTDQWEQQEEGERDDRVPASVRGAGDAVPVVASDETTVLPEVASELVVRYLDAAAPWAATVGALSGGRRLEAALVAQVSLRFDDARSGLDHREEWEAVLFPLTGELDWAAAVRAEVDERDFRVEPPDAVRYVLGDAPLAKAAFARDARKRLVTHLTHNEELTLIRNKTLGVLQRPEETIEELTARIEQVADERCDGEARELRDRLSRRADTLRQALNDARERVEDLEAEERRRRAGGLLATAGELLGSFLGGRRSSRTLARSVGKAAGDLVSGGTQRRGGLGQAEDRARRAEGDLAEIEAQLGAELVELDRKWSEVASRTEPVRISLTSADISVDRLVLCWIPTGP
ncbi:MAG: helicase HerA-like domain-containing protein [Acidimicrobiales bacterium]